MQHQDGKSSDVPLILLIMLLGLILRMVWVAYVFGSPVGFVDVGEATRVAQALANGKGFSDAFYQGSGPTAHVSPLVVAAPAALLWLFGPDGNSADIALQCWSLLQVMLAFLLAAYLFGLTGATRGAVLVALVLLNLVPVYFEQEAIDFRWWEGALATCLGLFSVILVLQSEGVEAVSARRLVMVASLIAATIFLSPPVGLASGACWAYFALRRLGWSQRGMMVASFTLVLAMMVVPWAIRNQQQLGSPVLLRSNAGLETALANHPDYLSERPTRDVFVERFIAIHPFYDGRGRVAMRETGGEVAYAKKLGAQSRQWIAADPTGFIILSARHIRQFFMPQTWQLTFGAWRDLRPWRAGWIGLINLTGLVALGFGLWKRRPGYVYLAIYIGAVAIPYMIVQPVPRYTYLVYVLLMFLAADGLVRAAISMLRRA